MGRNRTLELQLPQACGEDWDKMQANTCGRFCLHCSKTVIDFTTTADDELVRFFADQPEHICGRFREDQLNRKIPFGETKEHTFARKQLSRIAASLLLLQTSATNLQAQAQTGQRVVLKGSVHDHLSGKPLTGLSINVEGINYPKYSDRNGEFQFVLPASYAGKTVLVQATPLPEATEGATGFKIRKEVVQLSTEGQTTTVQLQRYPFKQLETVPIETPGLTIQRTVYTGGISASVIAVEPTLWQRIKNIFSKKKR